MKKSILFFSLLTFILFFSILSCNKSYKYGDDAIHNSSIISGDVTLGLKVGLLNEPNNEIALEIPVGALESMLINEGLFNNIVEITATRGFEPIEEEFKSFLTIIGKDGEDAIAIQYGLEITEDNIVYIPLDEGGEAKSETTHKCEGKGCSSCMFITTASGEIMGCKCFSNPRDGLCNHTVTVKTKSWYERIFDILKSFTITVPI